MAWTLFQALSYVVMFEVGKAGWDALLGWRSDIGRGILWTYGFWFFVTLALVANAVLETRPFVRSRLRRLALWSVAFLPLAAFTLPSALALPLAVLLVWFCTVLAVGLRESVPRLFADRAKR